MPASNSGCEHLYLEGARASAWRFSPRDPGWIPRSNGLPHPGVHCHVGKGDA